MVFGYELIIIGLMLVFNAVFAAYEMALASISRAKLQVLVNHKRKGAEEAVYMKDHMEASLAVVQVGITFVGAIAAATGGAGVIQSLSPYLVSQYGIPKFLADLLALVFLIIPLGFLTIVFAELIPKMYALNNKVWVCLTLSPAIKVFTRIFYPVISVFERVVKWIMQLGDKKGYFKNRSEDIPGLHELTAAAALARTSRLIGTREEKIVLSAAQFSSRPVKEIIIPIKDIYTIPIENSLSEALLKAHMDMHTRFPVCSKENDPQSIEGYVNFKDIVAALKLNPDDPSIKGILRPIKTVDKDVPISQVLEQMIQEKLHIALVTSKTSGVIGMITLEDIIEELVGEIEDEFDRLPTYIHPYSNGWIMGGGVAMSLVAQTTGWKTSQETGEVPMRLAEWYGQKLGPAVKGGEVITDGNLQVMARKVRRKKLSEAVVSIVSK